MKRSSIKHRPTKRSKEGAAALTAFKSEHFGKPCWYCETFPASEVHHIAKRRGKIYDDLRDFFAACHLCHRRMENDRLVNFKGLLFEPIPLLTVLEIKRRRDPGNWDLEFLRQLSGRLDFGEGLT